MVKTVFGSYKTRGKKKCKNIRRSVPRNPRIQAIIMRLRRGTTPKGTLPSPVKSLFSLARREDRNLGLSRGPVVKLKFQGIVAVEAYRIVPVRAPERAASPLRNFPRILIGRMSQELADGRAGLN